jgi:hypothetical protein
LNELRGPAGGPSDLGIDEPAPAPELEPEKKDIFSVLCCRN